MTTPPNGTTVQLVHILVRCPSSEGPAECDATRVIGKRGSMSASGRGGFTSVIIGKLAYKSQMVRMLLARQYLSEIAQQTSTGLALLARQCRLSNRGLRSARALALY